MSRDPEERLNEQYEAACELAGYELPNYDPEPPGDREPETNPEQMLAEQWDVASYIQRAEMSDFETQFGAFEAQLAEPEAEA